MNIQHAIEEELRLFLEGKAEDLVAKFPELKPAYEDGIKNPQYLQWIQKRRGEEPVEDIIDVVKAFDAAKQRLKAKKMSPDIYAYKTPAILRQALEDLGGSKGEERRRLKDEETTYIGEFGDWVVAMPHTRESSCQLGKGTTWCTAATQSQNLFYSYVARRRNNIVLYYVIKKGADPRIDPTSKLSIGFAGGEPVFKGNYGGVTVDAANNGIDYEKYKEILGDQALPALRAMEAHADSIEGKHPAKKQIEEMAKDVDKFREQVSPMKTNDKADFVQQILELEPSAEVIMEIVKESEKFSRSDKARIARKFSEIIKDPASLVQIAKTDMQRKHIGDRLYAAAAIRNPFMDQAYIGEILDKIIKKELSYRLMTPVRDNPNLSPENITKIIENYPGSRHTLAMAEQYNLQPSHIEAIIDFITNDPKNPPGSSTDHRSTAVELASNLSVPAEYLLKLYNTDWQSKRSIDRKLSLHPNFPEDLAYEIRPELEPRQRNYYMWGAHGSHPLYKDIPEHLKFTPPEDQVNEGAIYNEGNTMELTEDYIKQVIKEEYEALLDEKKKKPCKPAKGKRFAKRVNGKCRSFGQAGQAKGGGDRIRPGTKKGDAYCARSAKIKKCKNPPCANDLSRKKWKCRGSKSMK